MENEALVSAPGLREYGQVDPTRAENPRQAIRRWENEGGSLDGLPDLSQEATVAGEIGNAEDGNIRIRLIALENMVVALLAGASGTQSKMVREMPKYISPREGMTAHRLTMEAARNMLAMIERAARYRAIDERGEHEIGP